MWSWTGAWRRRADGLPEELQSHLEALREERLAMGDSEVEAERYARRTLGNCTAIGESVHEMAPWHFLDRARSYARMAVRALLRQKRTSFAAAAVLAAGIGMSAAMFSLVDAVLLRPLPFPDQKSIEVIWKTDPHAAKYVGELAYPELRDLQENIRDFAYVAVMPTSLYGYAKVLQTGRRDPVQIESAPVSHDFFRVLGVSPWLGRDFTAADERIGAPPVAIVAHRVWREHLGSDPHIVGRTIRLNGQGHTVIGVMGRDIEFPRGAGFWVPLGVVKGVVERRGATFLQAIARVKSGVPRGRMVAAVDGLVQRLAAEHPEAYSRSQRAVVTPLVEYWTGSSRPQLWILLGASVLLLAASILSAGILILSGVLARRTEIATRIALGARGHQILAQLGVEGALLALVAAVAGTGVAAMAVRILIQWAPAGIPRLAGAGLNSASIGFAVAAAAAAALVCTLLPGLSAMRIPPESVLREGGTRTSLSRHGLNTRHAFVLAQAAVTVTMLATAGLFALSYRSMMLVDTGFAHRDAVSLNVQLRGSGLFGSQGIAPQERRQFYARFLNRLREAPGVISAAAILLRPLEGTIGWERGYRFEFDAGRTEDVALPKANYEVVTPDYFRTVGTPLLEGRDFSEHDSAQSEPVAIVSRNLAERIRAAGHAPIGHRLRFSGAAEWLKVVGVCADARYRNVTQQDSGIFVPYLQAPQPTNYVVIRGTAGAGELAQLVRRMLAQMDPGQAAAGEAAIGELIDANTARHRFNMFLLLCFGGFSVALAAFGIYGVIAETMAARRREIAIRTALGAPRTGLVCHMVSRTLAFVLAGEAAGACATILVYYRISDLLYGVAPYCAAVLGLAVLFVSGVSLCAGGWAAWPAVDGDPGGLR